MATRLIDPVLAAPHDMAVRRAYADAIRSEQPDCAALIDHQLSIREALRRREEPAEADRNAASGLMHRVGERCCGPIENVVESYHYWGGMVEEVEVDARRFSEAMPALKGFVPLRMLTLTHLRGRIAEVLKEPILGQLVALDIGENHLTDEDIFSIVSSPLLRGLKVLRIAGNDCGYPALRALTVLPNLRFVDADDTKTPLRIYLDDWNSPTRDVEYTAAQGIMEYELGKLPWVIGALHRPSNHEI